MRAWKKHIDEHDGKLQGNSPSIRESEIVPKQFSALKSVYRMISWERDGV